MTTTNTNSLRQVLVRYDAYGIEPAEDAGDIIFFELEDSRVTREILREIVRVVDQLGEAELVELVDEAAPDVGGQLAVMYWGPYPQRARDVARRVVDEWA